MDGDTTTISHIHENVSEEIGVWSGVGHAKKTLYGHLMKLSTSHKSMTKTVVDYLVKCFGYVLTQNKGNPEVIHKGCKPCLWGSQFLWLMVSVPKESRKLSASVTASWQGS